MRRIVLTLTLLCFSLGLTTIAACTATAGETFIPADHANLVYVGRVSFKNPKAPAYTYPGIQIHAIFEGTSVAMKTKPETGYYMVEIDDLEPFKIHPERPDSIAPIAENLGKGPHRLTLTYCNEGLIMKPAFYGLILDAGCTLPEKPQLPERRIEFIGNSITCGYGNEGKPTDKKFAYRTQNVYNTYEAFAARELGAQWMVVARSGIGLYRNCNGNRNGDKITMRDLYDYTLFGTSGERWDFGRYTPDVVCVNLGTNDTTNPSYNAALLTDAFKQFVRRLRGKYPKAKIVLLTGTMINGKRLADLQAAHKAAIADAAARGDHEVYRLDFTPADGSLGYGTHKHPSLAQHRQMAQELVPFLKKITGWQ